MKNSPLTMLMVGLITVSAYQLFKKSQSGWLETSSINQDSSKQFSNPSFTEDSTFYCGQQNTWQSLLERNPGFRRLHESWEAKMISKAENRAFLRSANSQLPPPYELPVVVHVIHDGGGENIPTSQIIQGIQHLNDAFSNQGDYDPSVGIDTRIQFCLAARDPDGNTTEGINRVRSPLTNMIEPVDDLPVKNLSRWDPTQYINIWLVSRICSSPTDLVCGVAGYAYFPSAHGRDFDGIILESRLFGTSPANTGALIHEMGHYLGLYHTFQGGCRNDDCLRDGDRVCDTPPDQSVISVPCSSGINSCGTDVNLTDTNNPFTADQDDQINNYLDYGDFACYTQFTEGQRVRMYDAIETSRASLLTSQGCSSPCPTTITASFTTASDTVFLGDAATFTNTSIGATDYEWSIDDIVIPANSYTFNAEGIYEVKLVATNANPNCRSVFRKTIVVICGAQAGFTVDTLLIRTGERLTFTNTSTGAPNNYWTVNGGLPIYDDPFVFSASRAGLFTVCVIADNGRCSTQVCETVRVFDPNNSTEICNNGFDDDGDGLIDCYDPDCCDASNCQTNYYKDCPPEEGCDTSAHEDFAIQLEWQSTSRLGAPGFDVYAADVDNDGVTEVIELNPNNGQMALLDGRDGSTEWEISLWDTGRITYGDVDRDGTAEIFSASPTRIYRIEHDGQVTATNTAQNNGGGWYGSRMSLVDINQDGRPELSTSNQIFDAQTLDLLAIIPTPELIYWPDYGLAIFADFLPQSAACPDCDGLELVAGPFVWSLNNVTFEPTLINSVALFDPFYTQRNLTAIADMDLDGDLDAVISGSAGGASQLFIWDIQTPTIMADFKTGAMGSSSAIANFPAVADMNNDGKPDVIGRIGSEMAVIDNDLQSIHWRTRINEFGGRATQTIFDINGDKKPEVIFRDNQRLLIIDGQDGNILASQDCNSGTNAEYPSILDIDGDGEAEIACECGGKVSVFGSASKPWANTRKHWTQFLYFNTNIEDDLTIPVNMQGHHLVGDGFAMNSFLQQTVIPRPLIECVEICDNNIDDDNDGLIDCEDPDCCDSVDCINQPTPCDTCVFVGNIDLGPDVTVCDNGIFNFNAGSGFTSYEWIDKSSDSTYTAAGPGLVWVIATDSCGNTYSDTVIVRLEPLTSADLGDDLQICLGDSIRLEGGVFDSYQWFSEGSLICDGCPEISLMPTESTSFILIGGSDLGCFTADTVDVLVDTISITFDTLQICQGDTIEVFGESVFESRTLDAQLPSSRVCDSISNVYIDVISAQPEFDNRVICPGDTTVVLSRLITSDTAYVEILTNSEGCDYPYFVSVDLLPSITTIDTIYACIGDTLLVLNQEVYRDTSVSQVLTSNNGCDSISTILVQFNNVLNSGRDIFLCQGDTITFLNTEITADTSIFQTFNSQNNCDSVVSNNFIFRDVVRSFEEVFICQGDTAIIFGRPIFQETIVEEALLSTNGCDSIAQVQIRLLNTELTETRLTVCPGDTAIVFGRAILQDTLVEDIFMADNGCDSLVRTEVVFYEEITTTNTIEKCPEAIVIVFGQSVLQDTILEELYTASNGCDSLSRVVVRSRAEEFSQQQLLICEGDTVLVFGEPILENAIRQRTFTNRNGCDSTHTILVAVSDTIQTFETIDTCGGLELIVFGQSVNQDTTIAERYISTGGCDSIHTVAISFGEQVIIQDSALICPGEFISFLGDTIYNEGLYEGVLNPLSAACDTLMELLVIYRDEPEVDPLVFAPCPGENNGRIEIDNPASGISYSIDSVNYQRSPVFDNLAAGVFNLFMEDDFGCVSTLEITVPESNVTNIQLPEDTTVLLGDTIVMPIRYADTTGLSYSWSPSAGLSCDDCPYPLIGIQNSGRYQLRVSDAFGCSSDWFIYLFSNNDLGIYIPNIFSPNDDFVNDRFMVYTDNRISMIDYIQIFDRWGEMVYEKKDFAPNDSYSGWSGRFKGEELDPGVFIYKCKVTLPNGRIQLLSGDVTLVR